ncbi:MULTISPECIES: hypothetical protein [unclassified Mesorhizobium]|uniref:preATP grasp domain-containing protein n=1 Tax=unclassified Mesorhizobium TaxID=325217 RepID=UPI000FE807FA|nr:MULTISPECIES: hypothetical protein [unclassified Mesorhizobium]RWC10647.1 MAG: hypothetical protein EOS51_23130 [Mesorhizobium sp.]RWD74983.1 MAG: hypothetical protein EOS48_32285 [Mesorhizobium sp.]RWE51872.1 MAG: hypothetical protein EOS67_31625 [Mesorhizobium sp.]RWE90930.1 MAG: hypothetical protein EOS68_29500 [Mesorhizobium sp.]RWF48905.1 MAG: hypothetical protein EOS50_31435 [Mesorhizobium sp.]
MTAVILGNVGSDEMAPSVNLLSDRYLQTNAAGAKRMIWLAKNDDILVTPTPVTRQFLHYVNALKGGANIVALATYSTPTKRPLPISKKDLKAGSILSKSLSLLDSDRVSCLEPYIADEVSICIAKFLGDVPVTFSNQTVRASPEVTRRFNDKAKFREFAPNLGVPIASGSVCVSTQGVVDAAYRALSVSDKVILKVARHSGGDGNFVISKSIERSFQGATRAVCIREIDVNSIRAGVHEIGLIATEKEPVVVEAYNENESSVGVHFDIGINRVELVGVASILFNPGYGGAYWDKSLVDEIPKNVLAWCQNLGDYAHKSGYCGPFSVDIVKTKEVGFFACEVNGRHGGFSSVRAVSNSLGLEFDIKNGERVVLSRNAVPIGIRFPDLVDLLEERKLHYNSSVKRGAVVMVEGYEDNGPFDFVIVGNDLRDVQGIECDIIKLAEGMY